MSETFTAPEAGWYAWLAGGWRRLSDDEAAALLNPRGLAVEFDSGPVPPAGPSSQVPGV